MLSIDLLISGVVSEEPDCAYDIQKDEEYHRFSRWTQVSIPSVYKKVGQRGEKGCLDSPTGPGKWAAESERWEWEYPDPPLLGRTIFRQQALLYRALSDWLDELVGRLKGSL